MAGEKPLVRDRALVFSPRAPFAFVPEIPKKSSNEAGGAKGGLEGGISPRPPQVVCNDVISLMETDFAVLRSFLNKVRTFFAENPEVS